MPAIIARAALGLACLQPIGRLIAGPGKARRFHERFHQPQRQAVLRQPIDFQTPHRLSQQMTGQPRRLIPRQNQKAAVIGQMRQTNLPLSIRPADPLIACGHLPGCRAKEQAGQVLPMAVAHQIMNLPQPVGITQIMVLAEIACDLTALRLAPLGLVPG